MQDFIGIDVSKSTLQAYLPKVDRDLEIENSLKGLKRLLAKLKKGKWGQATFLHLETQLKSNHRPFQGFFASSAIRSELLFR